MNLVASELYKHIPEHHVAFYQLHRQEDERKPSLLSRPRIALSCDSNPHVMETDPDSLLRLGITVAFSS